jgi:hypothetical protein
MCVVLTLNIYQLLELWTRFYGLENTFHYRGYYENLVLASRSHYFP